MIHVLTVNYVYIFAQLKFQSMLLQNKFDLIIVGGGPAGTTAAKYAASKGLDVIVLEKDREIGVPVRCGEAALKM